MKKKGVIWNTLGSGMFAANSVLLLLIVSRVFGVAAAGDFGIVFTTAQILYIIGLFGINHFQMTDYAGAVQFWSVSGGQVDYYGGNAGWMFFIVLLGR